MTSFAARIKKAFSDMKVHRKLIVAYVLTGLFPMCLMFTLFYTQMRRVLVEREIKNHHDHEAGHSCGDHGDRNVHWGYSQDFLRVMRLQLHQRCR